MRTVVDVGLHDGSDTAYYLHRGCRVVAVDADPASIEAARARFPEPLAEGRLTLVHAGVAEREGSATFWLHPRRPAWNSFSREIASREDADPRPILVPCRPFRDILAEHGPADFIKIDIEGHDLLCVRDLPRHGPPGVVSAEHNGPETFDALEAAGYREFVVLDQVCFVPLGEPYARRRARHAELRRRLGSRRLADRLRNRLEGWARLEAELDAFRRQGDWTFPDGASGPLPEELPADAWAPREEAEAALVEAQVALSRSGADPYAVWFDVVARRPA